MPRTSPTSQLDVLLDLLRGARAERGATQIHLAERLGWRQTDISKVERGVRRLDVLELRAWVAALGGSFPAFASELDDRLDASELLQRQAKRGAQAGGRRKNQRP